MQKRYGKIAVGLLGGSFNPPHLGHVMISQQMRRRFALDQIWWLVSPANPLKSHGDLHAYHHRIALAQRFCKTRPWLKLSDFEWRNRLIFSVDTITRLRVRYKRIRFVWIMGADNLAELHRWRQWRRFAAQVPIAVHARPGYNRPALASPAARMIAKQSSTTRRMLKHRPAPAWCFIHARMNALSSTELRRRTNYGAASHGAQHPARGMREGRNDHNATA